MRKDAFWALMDANEELALVDVVEGATPEEDAIIVANTRTGRHYSISVPLIKEQQETELLSLLKGEREVVELVTVTRIVGYYSQVENWNRSKLGELEDRHKGRYALETVVPDAVPASASSAVRAAG
ncbi:MAG: hypothetical protein JW909_13325 [Planctomycetes bacterium]|nr:hypothetical protein [Planctomycetota bacterium]